MKLPTQTLVQNRKIGLLKLFHSAVLILTLVLISTGCGELSQIEKQAYFEKAIPIGQKYFHEHYDADVVFTDYDINLPNSSTMFLYGYVKNDQAIKVSLSLDIPSMEVRSGKGPEDFIKKRKSEDEVNSQ